MITVNDISVQFGGTTLFSDVTFSINENDKIALMGKNGAGKSHFLAGAMVQGWGIVQNCFDLSLLSILKLSRK